MGQVAITINGRNYDFACDDGQEEHLAALAVFVDKRVSELVATVGQIGDTRLLVLSSLLIADELHELRAAEERGDGDNARESKAAHLAELNLAVALDGVAERIETLAAGMENA